VRTRGAAHQWQSATVSCAGLQQDCLPAPGVGGPCTLLVWAGRRLGCGGGTSRVPRVGPTPASAALMAAEKCSAGLLVLRPVRTLCRTARLCVCFADQRSCPSVAVRRHQWYWTATRLAVGARCWRTVCGGHLGRTAVGMWGWDPSSQDLPLPLQWPVGLTLSALSGLPVAAIA